MSFVLMLLNIHIVTVVYLCVGKLPPRLIIISPFYFPFLLFFHKKKIDDGFSLDIYFYIIIVCLGGGS